jgi:hypothetical protein
MAARLNQGRTGIQLPMREKAQTGAAGENEHAKAALLDSPN